MGIMGTRKWIVAAILMSCAAFAQTNLGPIKVSTQDIVGASSIPNPTLTNICRLGYNTTSGTLQFTTSTGSNCAPFISPSANETITGTWAFNGPLSFTNASLPNFQAGFQLCLNGGSNCATVTSDSPGNLILTPATGQTIQPKGELDTQPATTSAASLKIPCSTSVAPSAPVDGQVWCTSAGLFQQQGLGTVGPFGVAGSGVSWALTVPNGLGSTPPLTGASDQPLAFYTQSNQNIRLFPNGTGLCQGCTTVVSVEKYVVLNSRTDIALAINDACKALPAQGGILDARDVPMPMEWASNPWGEGSNSCGGSGGKQNISLLLNAGAVCYNVPLLTSQNRMYVIGAGSGQLTATNLMGTWIIPVNSSGPYHAYCDSLSMSNFPQNLNAALGGPFPTSWIGTNGTISISTMTCTSGACSVKASATLPADYCSASACATNSASGSPGASYVYVGGNSTGLCNGTYQITGISTTTNTDDTFTYTTASGCNGPSIGSTFFMIANAVAGILDGQWPGAASTTIGAYCTNDIFEHTWENLVLVGNGIPSFVPYFNCGVEENSIAWNITTGDANLAQWVDDSTPFGPNAGGASHMHRHGIFPALSSNATLGSQKCSVSALTPTTQTQTLNDTTKITCATFTNAPVVHNWVWFTPGTSTGLTAGYYEVLGSGMGGCSTTPSTTTFCIATPNQGTAACSSCGATVSYGPIGMVMEGYKPALNQYTGGYEDCCWDTTIGASTTKQLWIAKWINGTYGLIAIKEHDEQVYNGGWEVGEGNTIDRWLVSSSGDVTAAPNLQSLDGGGSNQPQGPGWGGSGTGINLPSNIRLGPNTYNATLTSLMEIFGNSNVYADTRNSAFRQSSGATVGEGEGIGQYSQGTQGVPACYVANGTCASQASGIVQIGSAGATVSTTAVTPQSVINLVWSTASFTSQSGGTVTCNAVTNLASLGTPYVSSISAGNSFTIGISTGTAPTGGNPCVMWTISN